MSTTRKNVSGLYKLSSMNQPVSIASPTGTTIRIGRNQPLAIIAGPCVIESQDHVLFVAEAVAKMTADLQIPFIFKSSFDKANRTSAKGFRGLGMDEGLRALAEVKAAIGCPVISDVHSPEQAAAAAEVLDVLQIPAFLCRQTDLLEAAGATGKPVMIKKGQFLHPLDMQFAAEKVQRAGSSSVLLCERGVSFGYRELVVDFRSLSEMASLGCPVVFDATHSVQSIGGAAGKSGGRREFVPLLARAAVAVGVDAVFLETHPDPENAPSDGPNMIPLAQLRPLLEDLRQLSSISLHTRSR
jgi:2-dehydro-3-deoxyphosphooctonate aldolase (KDO 8-P synthase)